MKGGGGGGRGRRKRKRRRQAKRNSAIHSQRHETTLYMYLSPQGEQCSDCGFGCDFESDCCVPMPNCM